MTIVPIKTRIFLENDNLENFIVENIPVIQENSIVVVTSKIVALAEGRTAVAKTRKEKEALIKQESEWMMRTAYVWLTRKDDMLMASAGIDESNGNGKLILLPKDSYKTAAALLMALRDTYSARNIGILITDSRTLPLRAGVIGYALGYAGFNGLKNYIGMPDLFGRLFHFSRTDVADCLATSATLCMGEGAEQQPLALITEPPVEWTNNSVNPNELRIPPEDDLYRPFFENAFIDLSQLR